MHSGGCRSLRRHRCNQVRKMTERAALYVRRPNKSRQEASARSWRACAPRRRALSTPVLNAVPGAQSDPIQSQHCCKDRISGSNRRAGPPCAPGFAGARDWLNQECKEPSNRSRTSALQKQESRAQPTCLAAACSCRRSSTGGRNRERKEPQPRPCSWLCRSSGPSRPPSLPSSAAAPQEPGAKPPLSAVCGTSARTDRSCRGSRHRTPACRADRRGWR